MVKMTTKFGVTDKGFIKKTYSDIIDSLHANAKRMFGADVDLTPGSPVKIMIDLNAVELVGLWNVTQQCYNSAFLDTATDSSLDSIGQLVGASRGSGLYATGKVTFFRTTPLPSGSPRIIPSGTKVSTAMIRPTSYVTMESVYFQPLITDEVHNITATTYTFDTVNHIYEITAINGTKNAQTTDYSDHVVFSGRSVTFDDQVESGTIITISYKPLSVSALIQAVDKGADSNVAANTIIVMDTPIDFIHYIENEEGIDSGADIESDSHFRAKIIGATQSIGKATSNALEYYIGKVTGVKNVMIEDPLRILHTETIVADGTNSFFLSNVPVFSITSIVGSAGNTSYAIDNFDKQTGEVTLTVNTVNAETLTITYTYTDPGRIKIYVEGGETGNETATDTIVYAIETTRAAGIQSVGYGTNDPAAYGSTTAPFSWFYRPTNATIDVSLTVYFDPDSILSETAKDLILTGIQDVITDYINELDLEGKIYKNKLVQLAISSSPDILDAQVTSWYMNGVEQNITSAYIQTGTMTISIANNILITRDVA